MKCDGQDARRVWSVVRYGACVLERFYDTRDELLHDRLIYDVDDYEPMITKNHSLSYIG